MDTAESKLERIDDVIKYYRDMQPSLKKQIEGYKFDDHRRFITQGEISALNFILEKLERITK